MLNYNSPTLTLDEIVFEGRNQSYGGYMLRKIYDDNLLSAMLIAAVSFTLIIAAPLLWERFFPQTEAEDMNRNVVVTPIVLESSNPIVLPPKTLPQTAPPHKVKTQRFVPLTVANDPEVTEIVPNVTLFKDPTSSKTLDGDSNATLPMLDVLSGPSGNGVPNVIEVDPNQTFVIVEQEPKAEYDLNSFLASNLRYPSEAIKDEISGTVYVTFVVNADGVISNPTIAKGIGHGCDEEALRVIGKLPAWTPGKQGGRAVKVRVSVPIRFKLN